MRINTNIPAIQSYNALNATNGALARSIERLSTGLRINTAADDAAGLAISEKMRAQFRGVDQAVSNAQDGISMIQTAEGAMNETHSILQRMRELSVQAANDTLTQEDRAYIQLEVDELKDEIDRISTTTQFNKKQLLDGSSDAVWSTDTLGVKVNVSGTLLSRDQFGQVVKTDGNYKVVVAAVDSGTNQVLKSNIFSHASPRPGSSAALDSAGVVAGKTSRISDLAQFVDKSGKFILEDPQQLTVSFENGGSATITIYAEDTIGSLGEKLNDAMMKASGRYDEGSLVQWVGEESKVLYAGSGAFGTDTTGQLTEKLLGGWLEAAATKITSAYGGKMGDGSLTFKIDWGDLTAGTLGATLMNRPPADEISIELNKTAYNVDSPNWDDIRRTVMHEMVHAYQNNQYPGLSNFIVTGIGNPPVAGTGWLVEGLPEYVSGGNTRVKAEFGGATAAAVQAKMANVFNAVAAGSEEYAASYLMVRYFDEQTQASGGINKLLEELSNRAAPGVMGTEAAVDAAINAASGGKWANVAAFRADVLGASGEAFINKVLAEDPTVDNGTKGGFYASGGPHITNDVDPNGYAGMGFKTNPLEAFGVSAVELFGLSPSQGAASDHSSLSSSKAKSGTLQSVEGTLLLHSNIAGSAGRMSLSGSEDLIKALGFTEIQEASDVKYRVSVYDAHKGNAVVTDEFVTGTDLIGLIHENIDIKMLDNFALDVDGSSTLAGGYGSFRFGKSGGDFVVHIAANSTVLQVGANEGETFSLSFGNASSQALGVDRVKVNDRENASRAITIIDNAITKVSTRRARLGAYQNRLEHTINNLTTSSTNLKSSESRIRDLDMAKEMMTFTRLNILSQAGNSMLSQANNMPQNVLSLLR